MKIEVKESPGKGRGVFALKNIKKSEVIEVAPLIVLEFSEFIGTNWNSMFDYYFWLDDFVVLALGYGSLYNHTDENNAKYEINKDKKEMKITALKDISKGEEVFLNYKGSSDSKIPLWFERTSPKKD